MTTAIEAWFGGSATASIAANYRMRPEVRFYDLDATAGSLKALLPRSDLLALGTVIHVYNRNVTNTFQIAAQDGTNLFGCGPGQLIEVFLLDNGTLNGLWTSQGHSAANVQRGSALTLGREPWRLEIASGTGGYNMRNSLDWLGYAGVLPVAIIAEASADVVRGVFRTDWAGVDTGYFPAGSTLLFIQRGLLCGCGGVGGVGGGVGGFPDPPEAGGAGGGGLFCQITTGVVNYGTIQGGGGGGGGGTGGSTQGGGGGGGGGGYLPGAGGLARGAGATDGLAGRLQAGGGGGSGLNSGGAGGSPGTAGTAGGGSGGAGGAAGYSIARLSSVTVTKIRTGTLLGPEVVL